MEVISLYRNEVSQLDILSLMKNNVYNFYKEKNSKNIDREYREYTLQRKFLIALINKISRQMNFKTQTIFLAVNYLDIIFSKNSVIPYNYRLLALGCLIIASKFCENEFTRPIFKYFLNLYNKEVKDNVTKKKLFEYEIIICRMLNYKLNYFTIYDFNFFFISNGIMKTDQLKEINHDFSYMEINNNTSSSSEIKNILKKIYERSRHYLDIIIENLICLKYNSMLISICIMEKSIDYVLFNDLNIINRDASFNIDEIKFKNKLCFKEIMRDYYKIDYESLIEYKDLQKECENYKFFEDIYDNNYSKNNNIKDINLNNNKIPEVKSPSKKQFENDISFKQSPYKNNTNRNNTNEKRNYLYKKVNIKNKSNYNIRHIGKKNSPKERINIYRDNKFISNKILNLNNSNSKDVFYHKKQNNYRFRNSTSNNKDNCMKKSNTSSSPFNKISKSNLSFNKTNLVNKVRNKNKKEFNGSREETTTNSNSIDAKNYIRGDNIIINRNNKLPKPYIKKIIQNNDKIQEDHKSNININININNKISYKGYRFDKRNKSNKGILISNNNLSRSNLPMRDKSESKIKNKPYNTIDIYESSPIFERNNTITKYHNYIPYNRKFCLNNINIKKNDSNLCNSQEIYNNNDISEYLDNEINKSSLQNYNLYKKISNYNRYNSNLTSRNSFQYPIHNPKLTNTSINLRMNYLNNINDKNISSIMNYSNIDNDIRKRNNYIKYRALNTLQNKRSFILEGNNESWNENNNTMENNFNESYRKKKNNISKNKNDNNSNINISILENNYLEVNDESYKRHKNHSNINMID